MASGRIVLLRELTELRGQGKRGGKRGRIRGNHASERNVDGTRQELGW